MDKASTLNNQEQQPYNRITVQPTFGQPFEFSIPRRRDTTAMDFTYVDVEFTNPGTVDLENLYYTVVSAPTFLAVPNCAGVGT